VVHEVVKKHCDVRDWSLHALNVRSNHVHAVVSCDLLPKEAMRQFKEWATRALRRGGHVGTEAKVWTEGGSARWLWKDESVRRAVRYVIEYQGEGKRG
jgi:REP element-mobilizing transposase RayT